MGGKCLSKRLSCECGSSDGIQVFLQDDGTEDGYCFACGKYYSASDINGNPKPYSSVVVPMVRQETKMDLNKIKKLPSSEIKDRNLSKDTVEHFSVRVEHSEETGEIIKHYYPDTRDGDIVGYEVRDTRDKKFSAVGDRKGDIDLWGSHLVTSGKKLFITEGRLDAMSLFQSIIENRPEKYSKYTPAVVSLTRGAQGAASDLINNRKYLNNFDDIVLCFDMDQAGQKALRDCIKIIPTAKAVTLPLKDASDMLMAGRSAELFDLAVWNAQPVRMGEVVDVVDVIDKAMERPHMGIPFPWPTVTKACFGIRPNTIHCVGAAPKIGKTDHQHQLVHHLIFNEKVKVGMFDLENSPVRTAKKLASKHAKVDFTRPDKEYSDELLRSTLLSMNGMVRFYDRGASRDWDDIRIAMQEMHLLDGINIFILDPLTALISRYSSSEANDKLNEIATDMADLVQSYPITLFCYSHVNPKPKGSKPHEAGAKVLSSEFTGSRAMEKWFHYGHGISRDRTDDCPEEQKNMSQFYMLFDREYGQTYNCDVFFDEPTVTYLEPKKGWS